MTTLTLPLSDVDSTPISASGDTWIELLGAAERAMRDEDERVQVASTEAWFADALERVGPRELGTSRAELIFHCERWAHARGYTIPSRAVITDTLSRILGTPPPPKISRGCGYYPVRLKSGVETYVHPVAKQVMR